jgi:hypothetical protein
MSSFPPMRLARDEETSHQYANYILSSLGNGRHNDDEVHLSLKEFNLLAFMMKRIRPIRNTL